MDKLIEAQEAGVIIGLKDVSGIQPREDIDVLLTGKPNVFNLYLLALAEIQAEEDGKPQDKMGYFSIAGIHGLPNKYWDKVEAPPRPGFEAKVGGYCAHGYDLFPTWHRPYLAMMEQTIYAKVQDIAKRYMDPEVAQTYKSAAITFRLPFWDYFRPRGGEVIFPGIIKGEKETRYPYDFSMPRILTEENVMVRNYPNNELKQIQNPLYKYEFPKDESKTIPSKQWESLFKSPVNTTQGQKFYSFSMQNTTRYPNDSSPDKSSTDKMNQALNKDREGKTTTFLNFLTDLYKDYDEFATNGHFERDKNGAKIYHSSLEQLHGDYHGTIGGVSISEKLMGHMTRVPVAAFDPVFWLHHCNIDRMLAIYQATHPNSWLPKTKVGGTFVEEMALYPFRKIARQGATDVVTNFWTSSQSKNCDSFGYSYPHLDASSSAKQVRAKFEELHSWSVRKSPTDSFGKPPKEMAYIPVSKAQVFDFDKKTFFAQDTPLLSSFVTDSIQSGISAITNAVQKPFALESSTKVTLRQWYVDIAVLRHSQNGAFTLYYFIGDSKRIGSETEDYLIKPTLAGLTHVFVAPSEACDNCAQQAQANQLAIDSTPINPILLDYIEVGKLASLEPEDVKPFLIDNLRWRVVTINQDTIRPGDKGLGLEMSVSASLIRDGAAVGYETYPEIAEAIISRAGA